MDAIDALPEARELLFYQQLKQLSSFVYIDNPNNPTGQFLSNAELERIISKCEEMKVYAIIDEAYADFIPREESAVMLGPKYSHMISVRTFSKGFGLAGARAGYIITNKELLLSVRGHGIHQAF